MISIDVGRFCEKNQRLQLTTEMALIQNAFLAPTGALEEAILSVRASVPFLKQ